MKRNSMAKNSVKSKSKKLAAKLSQRFETNLRWAARAIGARVSLTAPDYAESSRGATYEFGVDSTCPQLAVDHLYNGLSTLVGTISERQYQQPQRLWLRAEILPGGTSQWRYADVRVRMTLHFFEA